MSERSYSRKYCPAALAGIPDHSTRRFRETETLYRIAAEKAPTQTWAEFGVGCGRSSRKIAELLDDDGQFFLFDSWQGIPDEWVLSPSKSHRPGSWKFPKLKTLDNRMVITDGWFEDTLPYAFPEQLGFVNLDCDVYSSTRQVLYGCDPFLREGSLLVFDELIGYRYFEDHEWRAVEEWQRDTGKNVEWLGKERFAAVGVVHE